jgi:hypothetical protein
MSIQTTYTTAPTTGFAGQKADNRPAQYVTAKNAEASASMPFGAIVAFKTSSPTSDDDSILPAATTAKLKGVVAWQNDFERTFTLIDGTTVGELDSVGLTVGTIFDCARSGVFFVTCEDGCNPGDRLFVRVAGGTLGAARSTDATGSTCIDATNCGQWLTTALAGGIAVLEFNFLAKTTAGA